MTDEVDDCLLKPSLGCQHSSLEVSVYASWNGSSIANETFDGLRSDELMLSFVLALVVEPPAVLESCVKNPFFFTFDGTVNGEMSDPGLWTSGPVVVDESMINPRGSVSGGRKQVSAREICFQTSLL